MAYNESKTRTWDRATPNDGLLFEAEYERIYDNFTAIVDNGGSAPTKTIQELANESDAVKVVIDTDSPYTISDSEAYSLYSVDTSGGDVTVVLPTLADNQGRKIKIIHTVPGNVLTVDGESTETIGTEMQNIELPKINGMLELQAVTTTWAILDERITSQLRLSNYAGYGSTDTKIMQFSVVQENIGNLFTENHVSGYSGGAEGLEITVTKSGKYAISFCSYASGGDNGLSLNSSQLTTDYFSINVADKLNSTYQVAGGIDTGVSWSGYLDAGDIVRPHTRGGVSTSDATYFTATYLGS